MYGSPRQQLKLRRCQAVKLSINVKRSSVDRAGSIPSTMLYACRFVCTPVYKLIAESQTPERNVCRTSFLRHVPVCALSPSWWQKHVCSSLDINKVWTSSVDVISLFRPDNFVVSFRVRTSKEFRISRNGHSTKGLVLSAILPDQTGFLWPVYCLLTVG